MRKRKSTGSTAVVTEAVAPASSSQPPVEIIIKVGGEGFSWTLLGRRKPTTDEWEFATECDERSLKGMLAEEDETGLPYHTKTEWVGDWQSALKLYAKYPWHSLFPLEVHKDFRAAVELALQERLMHDERLAAQDESGIDLNNWLPLCDERSQEKILQVLPEDGGPYWTLFGIRDGKNGWHFYTDWSLNPEAAVARLIPQNQPLPVAVPTWEEALELFDQRAWGRAFPIYVHPEFRVRVKSLLMRRKFGTPSPQWQALLT